MIVCIIILLFVSILATVILYMSGINYRMKKTDLNTKISFYTNEMPLERMESNLVLPVSEAMNTAYINTNSRYAALAGSDARRRYFYSEFEKAFKETLVKQYSGTSVGNGYANMSDPATTAMIQNILHNLTYTSTGGGLADGIDQGCIIVNDMGYPTDPIAFYNTYTGVHPLNGNADGSAKSYMICSDAFAGCTTAQEFVDKFVELDIEDPAHPGVLRSENECRLIIRNVGVVTVQNGYRSIVTTDIAIQFPPIDWSNGFATSDYHNYKMYQLIYYINWQKS